MPAHVTNHAENGSDEILVEALGTAGPVNMVPTSDGLGGLVMAAPASGATKEFWYPMLDTNKSFPYNQEKGSSNQWALARENNNEDGHCLLRVPHDYTTLTDLVIVIIPDTTETIQFDAILAAAASGEDFETVTNSIVDSTLAVTLNQLTELNLSALFTGVAALDYVGIQFTANTQNIELLGLRLRYT